jgi:hypothetical protein
LAYHGRTCGELVMKILRSVLAEAPLVWLLIAVP